MRQQFIQSAQERERTRTPRDVEMAGPLASPKSKGESGDPRVSGQNPKAKGKGKTAKKGAPNKMDPGHGKAKKGQGKGK